MDNRTKSEHPILASAKEALISLEEVISPTPLQQTFSYPSVLSREYS